MKKTLLILALFLAALAQGQEVLFSIDDETFTTDEFKAVYLKNRDIGKNIDPKTPAEYLDLYVNFKLKVKEARDLGMDTVPQFTREFSNYRAQLAKPYLEDRRVDSQLVGEAYARLKLEVEAAHIMIDLSPTALPEDTLKAYNQIMKWREQVVSGQVDFAVQARKHSTDVGSATNGGNLGYFTVFDMVYPFENAAYNTPVGEVSMPVRSQFGYHIVKVLDKRANRGSVQVKHIFLVSNDKTDSAKAAVAEKRINEIYGKLQAGEDFDQLAKQFSEDKNTADKGGLLKPFGINQMLKEFEEASFGLENVGDYSKPFKSSIGWHIVKLVDKKGVAPFDEAEQSIKQQIARDSRAAKSKQVFIANLKEEYNFKEDQRRLTELYKVIDESYLNGQWDPASASKYKKTLFTLDGKNYNQQDFIAYLNKAQKRGGKSKNLQEEVYRQYTAYVDKTVIDYEDSRLEEKYPDFKLLVGEYRDGILLFDLTQEKVWNAASQDSVGLYEFWDANKENYMWPDRVEALTYSCESEKVAKKVAKMVAKGSTTEDIEAKFNGESELAVVADSGKYAKGANAAVDATVWETGTIATTAVDGRFIVVKIIEMIPSAPKELSEARGLVISDYQKKLEDDWIAELKEKYTVTINEEVFRSLEQELN